MAPGLGLSAGATRDLPAAQSCFVTLEHRADPTSYPEMLLPHCCSHQSVLGFVSRLGSVAGAASPSGSALFSLLKIPGQERVAPELHAEPGAGAL